MTYHVGLHYSWLSTKLGHLMRLAVFVTLTSFVIIMVTCLARSASRYEASSTVWATFLNGSGWNSGGVAFLTGLVSPNYMYAGIDGALHLAEECRNATTAVPRALMSTLIIGFVTSFAFMITMLYCTSDLDAVVASSTGSATVAYSSDLARSDTNLTLSAEFPFTKCGIRRHAPPRPLPCSFASFCSQLSLLSPVLSKQHRV